MNFKNHTWHLRTCFLFCYWRLHLALLEPTGSNESAHMLAPVSVGMTACERLLEAGISRILAVAKKQDHTLTCNITICSNSINS